MGISQLTEPFEPFKPCICIGLRVLLPPILTYSYLFPYLVIGYTNKIDMAGECPAPYQLSFNILGYEQNHSISYEPLCGALVLLKPIFVGSGALSGMFILMGYSRASNTGVNG